jgi:hypothetical protein
MIYFKRTQSRLNALQHGIFLLGLLFVLHPFQSSAQQRNTELKVYGHFQYAFDDVSGDKPNSYFSLGEQDFFVTSNLNDKISFLGETVVRYDNATSSKFAPSIERAQLKFDYFKNHSIIMGKMHTPVNYWNDVFHHGRLFYPTIDRPSSFSFLIPLHSLGLRAQGQNLGKLSFGYDFSATNSISSTDILDSALNKSLTAAVHIKPIEGMRIGASYYNDYLSKNTPGAHAGHSSVNSDYKGAINYELTCFSFAYFGKHLEFLSESAYNRNKNDSLGVAENYSQFIYAGWRFKEKHAFYGIFDYMDMSERELHVKPANIVKLGLGYKIDILYNCVMKIQFEQLEKVEYHLNHAHKKSQYDIRFQLAYGF